MIIKKKGHQSIPIPRALITDTRIPLRAKGLYMLLAAARTKEIAYLYRKKGENLSDPMRELIAAGWLEQTQGAFELYMGNTIPEGTIVAQKRKDQKLSKEDWRKRREEERKEFALEAQQYWKQKGTLPKAEFIKFCEYWAAIDTIDPSKKMPFQQQRTFNIPGRLRTWERNYNERNNDGKL